jgi:hypothetical protein
MSRAIQVWAKLKQKGEIAELPSFFYKKDEIMYFLQSILA